MSDNTFLFQVNVTRDCDLRCTHCYISSDKKIASSYMSDEEFIETMAKIADFMDKDAAGAQRYQLADIHVIGGEPSMLGVEFFERNLPIVKERFSQVKQQVKLSIVTNLYQKRAVEIARMFDEVSTSYEVDSRFTKAKQEERWQENCRQLVSEGVDLKVTTAVTKPITNWGAENLLNFHYDIGFKNVHLGFFIPSGDGMIHMADVFPRFEETTKFMIDATSWYLERRMKDKDLYVNPVESMIESIYRNKIMDDIVCPIITGSLDIDSSGETLSCLELGGEIDSPSLGNVFETDVITILESRPYIQERRKAITPKPHCIGCDELEVCNSACGVLHDYWNGKGECPGFRGFIKHIRNLVKNEGVKPKSELLGTNIVNGGRN